MLFALCLYLPFPVWIPFALSVCSVHVDAVETEPGSVIGLEQITSVVPTLVVHNLEMYFEVMLTSSEVIMTWHNCLALLTLLVT